jgi:ribosomal protein S18 acetylase RimI-like enzyme
VLELCDVAEDRRPELQAIAVERVAARRTATRFVPAAEARDQVERLVERTTDSSAWLEITESSEPRGWMWLAAEGEELVVYHLELDSSDAADEVLAALVERAQAQGARMIGLGVSDDAPALAALGALPGFTPRATNMVLPLDGDIADPAPLRLRPMSEAEFDVWVDGEVEGYAEELAATGLSPESALEHSRTQMAELIPDGVHSPGMEFFSALVDETVVGDLWLDMSQDMAFVYNIEVGSAHRRRGYGAAIMNAGARYCRDAGHPYLGLNVFAHNPNARALYDKLGYRVTVEYRALDVPDAG